MEEQLEELKVVELRARLSSLGLPVSGLKEDLVNRLHKHFSLKEPSENDDVVHESAVPAHSPECAAPAPASNVNRKHNAREDKGAAAPTKFTTADRVERTIREIIGDGERVQNLLSLSRGIINIILLGLCMINPGGMIGAGIGGFIGLLGFAVGPRGRPADVALGMIFGGLIGTGCYKLDRERRDRKRKGT